MSNESPTPQYARYFSAEFLKQANKQIKVEAVNTAARAVHKTSDGDVVLPDEMKNAISKFVDPAINWPHIDITRAITAEAKAKADRLKASKKARLWWQAGEEYFAKEKERRTKLWVKKQDDKLIGARNKFIYVSFPI